MSTKYIQENRVLKTKQIRVRLYYVKTIKLNFKWFYANENVGLRLSAYRMICSCCTSSEKEIQKRSDKTYLIILVYALFVHIG